MSIYTIGYEARTPATLCELRIHAGSAVFEPPSSVCAEHALVRNKLILSFCDTLLLNKTRLYGRNQAPVLSAFESNLLAIVLPGGRLFTSQSFCDTLRACRETLHTLIRGSGDLTA